MKGRIPYTECPLCAGMLKPLREDPCEGNPRWIDTIDPVMRWMECRACGHVCTEGYFTLETWAAMSQQSIDEQKVGFDVEQQRWVFGRMLEWTGLGPGRLLDVGFGNGGMMFTADELGWDACGVDLRRENCDAMRQMGFQVWDCQISHVGETFELVAMCDVLEHMVNPKGALRHARKVGECLLISCPNMGSVAWQALGDQNPYWREIEHFHNFSRQRLVALLKETGWKVEKVRVSERYRLGLEILAS